ncbi:androglobin, partial [Hypomesus transpacificus]|uniref:androglobin n=1 Tax=Hypomesus transpacificus TaxID=137520 RepID=UPI001F07F870
MADSSETLRQYGLLHLYSHPVLVSRTRSCPLVAPPISPPVPRWKLIRPRKESLVTDEPREPAVVKLEQHIEVCSPFLHYRVLPAAPDKEAQKSAQRRGVCSSTLESFDEMEESDSRAGPEAASAEHSSNPLDPCDTPEVTVEDKRKDDNTTNDQEVVEAAPALAPALASAPASGPASEKPKAGAKVASPVLLQSQEGLQCDRAMLQETWVDLNDFAKCFQTLLVFHKTNTYPNHSQASHFKSTISSKASASVITSTAASTNSTGRHPGPSSAALAQ